MTSLFVCPLCGAALTRDERAYHCPAGHSFDIAPVMEDRPSKISSFPGDSDQCAINSLLLKCK